MALVVKVMHDCFLIKAGKLCNSVKWIQMTQNRIQFQAAVIKVLGFWSP